MHLSLEFFVEMTTMGKWRNWDILKTNGPYCVLPSIKAKYLIRTAQSILEVD